MLGKRIKALRESRGLSGPALAKLVGIKAPSLWEIENGETKSLRADTLMRLADALQTNARYIWTGRGNPAAPIDPNDEEAEAASLYRQMTHANRQAWLAAGYALRQSQPPGKATADDPYPKAAAKRK